MGFGVLGLRVLEFRIGFGVWALRVLEFRMGFGVLGLRVLEFRVKRGSGLRGSNYEGCMDSLKKFRTPFAGFPA